MKLQEKQEFGKGRQRRSNHVSADPLFTKNAFHMEQATHDPWVILQCLELQQQTCHELHLGGPSPVGPPICPHFRTVGRCQDFISFRQKNLYFQCKNAYLSGKRKI